MSHSLYTYVLGETKKSLKITDAVKRRTENNSQKEKFEDTKGVIRSRKSNENRQYNGQKE
jgi:hypothetical protein